MSGPQSKVPRCGEHSARGEPDVWRCRCRGRGREVWRVKGGVYWGIDQVGKPFLKGPDSKYFRLASQAACNSEVVV